MTKYAAFGVLLKRGATTIANVTNISGPSMSLDTEDVTSMESTGAWEEVVATILRSGEISVDLVFDPNAATHKNLSGGMLYDMISRTAQTYSITFPGPIVWSFSALVTGWEPSAPVDGALTVAGKMKINGQPTLV
jgi:predicted secreted protein